MLARQVPMHHLTKLNGRPVHLLRVFELREELGKRNLPKHGKQVQLVLRLTHHLQQNPHEWPNSGAWSRDPSAIAEKQCLAATEGTDSSSTLQNEFPDVGGNSFPESKCPECDSVFVDVPSLVVHRAMRSTSSTRDR